MRNRAASLRDGFILFEVMIAIAIFSIVSLGLAMAMQATIDASNYLDKQTVIRYGLESIMNEALRKPKREEMLMSFKDEALGISYRTEMQQLRFVNVDGDSLDHMWTLIAVAQYVEDGEEREEKAELYVYRPK